MKKTNLIKKLFFAGALATAIFSSVTAFAATTLYEQIDEQILAKGINYQFKHRLTSDGWLDIYVLTADLSNENISVNPVESTKEIGLKETIDALLNEHDAVAGVNSAYFGLKGTHSASFGPVISFGDIVSIDTDKNINSNQFGTMFIDDSKNPMFGYFKTTMNFVVGGNKLFEFASINKITEMKYPIIFDKNGGTDTSQLDARFPGLLKIVVENDKITYISQRGETVKVPEDGYLVILGTDYANAYESYLSVGQSATVDVNCNFNLDSIETAITGGGIILDNGQKPANIGEMSAGRQPRTLLGLSQDKKTLKLIVVDGQRSSASGASIGMTPDECIELLKSEGMYYGLNLDGGGSSTMAVSDDYGTAMIVNNSAEGTPRKVMTAVGIFDESPVTEPRSLIIESASESVTPNGTFDLKIYGYDDNYHKILINASDVNFTVEGGTIEDSKVKAGESGTVIVKGEYNGMTAECRVPVAPIIAINTSVTELYLDQGQTANFTVTGTASSGATADITNYVTVTTDFGTVTQNTYTAPNTSGGGLISINYNGLTCYIKVNVGSEEKAIDSFENIQYLNFSSYPTDIQGIAGVTTKYVSNGSKALGLSYYFKQSDSTTQAAYLTFPQGIAISGKPNSLLLDIYGNGTGQWVRGKITDATGAEFVIDFSRDVIWNGEYQTVTAEVPKEVVYPIKLNTIYVAALTNNITAQQVMYFDNLRGEFVTEYDVAVPEAVVGSDSLKADTSGKADGFYYANIGGSVTSSKTSDKNLYTNSRVAVRNVMEENANVSVYAGSTDIAPTGATETIKWVNDYAFYSKNGIDFVNLTAVNGGLKDTKASQWQQFKNNILATDNKCVVFLMDTTPSNFEDELEAELFRTVLQDLRADDRTIFVVSASGTSYWENIRDGVRYINLGSLWKADGSLNTDYRVLRIKTDGSSVNYEVKKVF